MKEVGMSEDEYNKIDAVRSSDLKTVRDSLFQYKHKVFEKKPHLDYGIALHCAILEPEKFESSYISDYRIDQPIGAANKLKANGGCKEANDLWKKARNIYLDKHNGKIILSVKDMDAIRWSRDNIYTDDALPNMLAQGEKEVTYVAKIDNETNGKARLDLKAGRAIVDFKTAKAYDYLHHEKTIETWKYHMQGAWHAKIVELQSGEDIEVIFYCLIQKEPPYMYKFYPIGAPTRDIGELENMWALEDLKKYKADNTIAKPCANKKGIKEANLSVWYVANINEERDLRCAL